MPLRVFVDRRTTLTACASTHILAHMSNTITEDEAKSGEFIAQCLICGMKYESRLRASYKDARSLLASPSPIGFSDGGGLHDCAGGSIGKVEIIGWVPSK